MKTVNPVELPDDFSLGAFALLEGFDINDWSASPKQKARQFNNSHKCNG